MFKFLRDLFLSSPSTGPHPLDGPTKSAPYKVEPLAQPALEVVAEPAVVVVEQPAPIVEAVTVVPEKKSKTKAPSTKKAPVKTAAAEKPAVKGTRGRKPKVQKKSK